MASQPHTDFTSGRSSTFDPNIGTVAQLAQSAARVQYCPATAQYPDAAPYIIVKDGDGNERVEYINGRLPPPERKRGHVKLRDIESFIAYHVRHNEGGQVYATRDPARFVAVLNDHDLEEAGHRDHRADYVVSHSNEWTTWTSRNGREQAFGSCEEFALFLEDNAVDIVDPDPATMLRIALNFRVQSQANFSTAQRLSDGNIDFTYSRVVSDSVPDGKGGKIQIPEMFTLQLPVFDSISPTVFDVQARFRYRLREGGLTLWYELVRPHKVVEAAFRGLVLDFQKRTGTSVLHGMPE